MTRAEAVARVEAILAAWNARDLDAFAALLAPDVVWYDLGMAEPPAVGREAARRWGESVLRAMPDFSYALRGPVCASEDGASCAVPWVVTATHTGPLEPPGFAPTGRRVRVEGVDYITFRGALAVRIESWFDPVDAGGQLLGLGLRPPPGSRRERALVALQRLAARWIRRRDGPPGPRPPTWR